MQGFRLPGEAVVIITGGLLYRGNSAGGVAVQVDQRLEAAEQGDLDAQIFLGSMFYLYDDYEQSAKWITKAAKQGDVESMYNLGFLYLDGIDVEEDDEQALAWIHSAVRSQFNIALFIDT